LNDLLIRNTQLRARQQSLEAKPGSIEPVFACAASEEPVVLLTPPPGLVDFCAEITAGMFFHRSCLYVENTVISTSVARMKPCG